MTVESTQALRAARAVRPRLQIRFKSLARLRAVPVAILAGVLLTAGPQDAEAGWAIQDCFGCTFTQPAPYPSAGSLCQAIADANSAPPSNLTFGRLSGFNPSTGTSFCLIGGPNPPPYAQIRKVQDCPLGSTYNMSSGQCNCQNGQQWDGVANVCRSPGQSPIGLKNVGICPICPGPAGDPVTIGVRNKYQVETDFVQSGTSRLRFVRVYNSHGTVTHAIGAYWQHNYQKTVVHITNGARAYREDGRVLTFTYSSSTDTFFGDADIKDRLEYVRSASGQIIGYRFRVHADDSVEEYDFDNRLLKVTDRQGLVQTMTYSTAGTPPEVALRAGLLIRATDHFGRSLSFTYDAIGRIATMTDPAGGVYLYTYDGLGNLASVTYPGSQTRSYHYEKPTFINALTGITDENAQRFATWAYDGEGRAVSSELAGGVDRFTFGPPNGYFTDAFGQLRIIFYTTLFGMERPTVMFVTVGPAYGPAENTYDANANVASTKDWNGNRTNYTYDLARNLQILRVDGLTSGGATTLDTRTTSTEWHPTFGLPARVAEPLRITSYTYNGDGSSSCGFKSDGVTLVPGVLCSKTVQATSDANGGAGFGATVVGAPRTWSYTYNGNGSVLTVDGPRSDAADLTTYTYHPNDDADFGKRGSLAVITNALGHVTSVTGYNAHGQPTTIVDPNGLTTTLAYDPRMRLISRSVGGETTSYEYDGVGQLTKVTLPDGSFLAYTYDSAHRLTALQDNLGNCIAYMLDAMGNRTKEDVLDPANALAQTRSRVISNLNRLFREVGATGQTTEYAYDNQGNVTSVRDPLNRVTANAYDALNRLRQVTDPTTGVTQHAYNGLDQLTQVTDPRSHATTYTVDGLGNLTQQVSPDSGTTASIYDAAGNLLTQTDAKSQTTSYAHDALNRVTSITFADGSKHAYAYDQGANGLGRLTTITESDLANAVTNQIAYGYDPHGRVTSETRSLAGSNFTSGYQYDAAGRMSAMTYPSGRTVTYAFDALGRISAVSTAQGLSSQVVVQNVQYHPFGGVKSYTLGNGQIYTRGYDLDGRIASYTLGGQTFAIGYDAASRIGFISDVATPANSNSYGYDDLDRLTNASLPGNVFAYSYDAVGNRLSKTVGSATDTYSYSAKSNRLASITPAASPPRSVLFDANGSTTNDGLNQYTYDARGRMVQATSVLGTTTYQVNALGQRVRKTNAQGDTVFHYDLGGRLIAETAPGGTLKREILYLGDIPVAVIQ